MRSTTPLFSARNHPSSIPLMAVAFTADVGLVAPLVKLIPQPIVEAESLALAAFRLIKQTPTPIGYTTHQPSSFLTWAVLTDPTNAHHALSLVRELQKARRHANDQAGKVKTPFTGTGQDPRASAPTVVADVEQTLGLSADAACYFLQLLALLNPTDTNTKKWNGWTKKQLDTARSELLAKNLVVEAKHTGAGRSVFLPGGWCEKSHSGPGLEVWKAPHYLLWNTEKATPVIPTCPPILPYPHLYAEVWQRYTSGDTPGHEELRTTRYGQ